MKNDVGNIADAKFKAIISFQRLALNLLAIDKSPVLAALVDDAELPVFGHDQGMIARHTRIRDHQILINFSPYAEGTMVEIDVALLVALDEDQDGEYSGAGVRYWTSNGLESHGATAEVLSFTYTIMTALEVGGKGA